MERRGRKDGRQKVEIHEAATSLDKEQSFFLWDLCYFSSISEIEVMMMILQILARITKILFLLCVLKSFEALRCFRAFSK